MPKNSDRGVMHNRRAYVRIDSVFPVQFLLLSTDGQMLLSDWLQGFTGDVGKGGICLQVNFLDKDQVYRIKSLAVKFSLLIEFPLHSPLVIAEASPAWVQEVPGRPEQLRIGLRYVKIAPADAGRIMRYAWSKKLFVPVVASLIAILAIIFVAGSFRGR